jgi:hypothetical protein
MADIDIEKRSSHGLLWSILGLAALGLLLFWLLRGTNRDRISMVEEPATEPVPTAPAPVERTAPAAPGAVVTPGASAPAAAAAKQQYQQQCANAPTMAAGTESQHASRCLGLLTNAIEGSVSSDKIAAVRGRLDSARSATTQLGTAPDATAQARHTRDAFNEIAGALESLNPTGASHDAATQLSRTVEALRGHGFPGMKLDNPVLHKFTVLSYLL